MVADIKIYRPSYSVQYCHGRIQLFGTAFERIVGKSQFEGRYLWEGHRNTAESCPLMA